MTLWGSTAMTYDNNGNTLNDGTNAYVWDARNRLVSANSNEAAFTYDPLGRRASKTFMSTTTDFVYDGPNPVRELNGSTVTANLLTAGVDERFQRTDATGSYRYLTDALGSTEALTTSSGSEQTTYTYSPYGAMSITGSTTNSYDYTGRESDGLGLHYYRARYYNPDIGRFISEDPMGLAAGPNEYAYVGDSPINFIDPSGMDRGSGGPGGPGGPGGCGGGIWTVFGGGCSQSQAPSYNPDCAPCLNPGALGTQSEGNEPNPFVPAVTDFAGVAAALLDNTPLGIASSLISASYDPSYLNLDYRNRKTGVLL